MRYNAQPFLRKFMTNVNDHIAMILKALRAKQGWSLDKTAEKTGVSKAMLGQIERGESSPTIATLWKIAHGFQTSFSSFLEELPSETKEPVHRTNQENLEHESIRVTTLFPFDKQLQCEMFALELAPHYEYLSVPHQTGVIEHVIVIEGCMEILIHKEWQRLKTGEGLRFNADQPHGYRNPTNKKLRFHSIIHYPK